MRTFRAYEKNDVPKMTEIWNAILRDGEAFPGETMLTEKDFEQMLAEQSAVTCMVVDGELAGYYVLHPNNIGRCSHVANASYCLDKAFRGKGLAGELVAHSLQEAKELGFLGMQFNAVVVQNHAAIHTYQKQGFQIVGTIPNGFRLKDDSYSDMHVMYRKL